MLDGRPTLRHPGGEDELELWDVVLFPPGPEGAYMVCNDTDSTARVDVLEHEQGRREPSISTAKIAIWTGNDADDLIVKRTSGVGHWWGESRQT